MNRRLPWRLRRPLLVLAALGLVLLLTLSRLLSGANAWWYDGFTARAAYPFDERILAITIDQKSLAELGRWPWPRRVHAQLIDRLTAAGAAGVALDILLSESALSDPEGDALLARALADNGKVVLPVWAEPADTNSPITELLPIPELATAAAALGHTDLPPDRDGVARSMFLRAGTGSPHWASLALALYQIDRGVVDEADLPGLRLPASHRPQPYQWVGDHKVLVPYASPPNGYRSVSYTDVLHGRVAPELLRDRLILVGATASGISQPLSAPGYGLEARLVGLDYQANALNMLLQGNAITPLSLSGQLLLSAVLVLLPLLLAPLLGERAWLALPACILLAPLLSAALLRLAGLWYPPMPAITALGIWLLLRVARQWRHTRNQARSDPLTGLANRSKFDQALENELRTAKRGQQSLSLLLIDIDHFKQLNDSHGHPAGDAALRDLARVLRNRARRPRDLVARLGGDEFAMLLPETTAQSAATIAATLHVDLANRQPAPGKPAPPPYTVSIGIDAYVPGRDDDRDHLELFERADTALYASKQLGRNRSFRHGQPAPD